MDGSAIELTVNVATDVWTTVAQLIAAGVGLAALVVSVVTAVGARKDARTARTALAEANAQLAGTHLDVSAQQIAAARQARLEESGRRSAAMVHVRGTVRDPRRRDRIGEDHDGEIHIRIANHGATPITAVNVTWDRRWGLPAEVASTLSADPVQFRGETVLPAHAEHDTLVSHVDVAGHDVGDVAGFTVEFDDIFGDRWRRTPDGTLTLINGVRFVEGDA